MIYSTKTFKVPVYASKVTVLVVDECAKEYNRALKKVGSKDLPMDDDPTLLALACFFDDKIGSYYLIFSTRKPLSTATIAHECFHLALAICAHFGVTIAGDEEAPAYLFEHLFTEVAQYLLGPLNDKDLKLQVQVRKSRRVSGKDVLARRASKQLPAIGKESEVEKSSDSNVG